MFENAEDVPYTRITNPWGWKLNEKTRKRKSEYIYKISGPDGVEFVTRIDQISKIIGRGETSISLDLKSFGDIFYFKEYKIERIKRRQQ